MSIYLLLGYILLAYMSLWFIISLAIKRNDVADIAWGLGFILLAWTSYFLSDSRELRGLIVSFLVSIWGARLALHIYSRNRAKQEDYRYLNWRKTWGKWFVLRSYLQIYILQGVLLFIISLPVIAINTYSKSNLNLLDFIGILVWLVGYIFETVGDAQLARFKKNPTNNKVLDTGLWKYTRHPNYFGEVTQWWGIWIISLSVTNGLLSVIGPITITLLILKISGIPMLEKELEKNPEYIKYKNKTSGFIPLPSRK